MQHIPTARPPEIVPKYCRAMRGTGPEFIRQYTGFLVYIWTIYGNGFWIYSLGVDNGVLSGYLWKNSRYQYTCFNVSIIDCLY
jgi:hypothetical protein